MIKVIPKIGCLITPNVKTDPKRFRFNGFNAEIPTNTFKSPPANNPSSQSINVITKVIAIEIIEFNIYEKFQTHKLTVMLDTKPIPKNKKTR